MVLVLESMCLAANARSPRRLTQFRLVGCSTGVDHTMYGNTIQLHTTPVNEDGREGTYNKVFWVS